MATSLQPHAAPSPLSPPPASTPQSPAHTGFTVPCQAVWARQPPPLPSSPRSSSHCHPVFFTDKLRRQPPFRVSANPHPHASPVAHGYVYQDAPRGSAKSAGPRL
ncbi:5ee5b3de-d133-4881-9226-50984bff219f [Thermothielavioides terrestris]|uniref:5ee5b3de-d133-4881-9226-50984bff219f n=1 Tax=Thermothielavioides terrestris TaxID=2587410 RepID=A0A3S4AQS2_9PEZI|nr:5ee5b3de-d133-4881-9226-50984bff219f [Thermothielavioides terrestris]